MILAIDIGNTNIVLGCVEGKKTFFIERLSTDKAKTELEYAVSLKMCWKFMKSLWTRSKAASSPPSFRR